MFALLLLSARGEGFRGLPVNGVMLVIAVVILVAAGIIGLLIAGLFDRRVGQVWASGLALAAITGVLAFRLFSEPSLGVTTYPLDEGVMVVVVQPDSVAAGVGIRYGDVIWAMDGLRVNSPTDLVKRVHSKRVFDRVALEVLRDGQILKLDVVLLD